VTDPTHGPGAELVDVRDPADPDGRVVGTATRAEVRARNLPHAATGVLLRHDDGRVFVHRRTTTKDVYPGRHDCLAGGVLAAGEDPGTGAARELAEELGVRGVVLHPVLRCWYRDEDTHYLAHVYETGWDGRPLVLQPAEVDAGWWMGAAQLESALADPSWPFVPDTRRLLSLWPGWRVP
jgi:isopentenyldiphosphate isomerase